MVFQRTLTFKSPGRGTTNITPDIQELVAESGVSTGTCHVFVQHTSASLMLCENADPDVRHDLETFM
jgi:secondary thiamine-phosphate synthase enzyme